MMPILDSASLSDTGRKRLANEDACCCNTQMGMFVVCDGIGGQPSGEAASQIIAHCLGHLVRRRLRALDQLDAPTFLKLLEEVTTQISDDLHKHSRKIASLAGMGATLVAAIFDGPRLYLLHVGDSRAYLLRQGELTQLTKDHTRSFRRYDSLEAISAEQSEQNEQNERRLLIQYIGSQRSIKPAIECIEVRQGDRFLLCSDGLTDPVDDRTIQRMLGDYARPAVACKALVDAANANGGPDNITVVVIDSKGLEPHTLEPSSSPQQQAMPRQVSKQAPRQGVAADFHAALRQLEKDLVWLQDGARECAESSAVSAFAAVKRRLGADVYRGFLQMHPSKNPVHVYHRACTMPDSVWRKAYQEHMRRLEPITAAITEGLVRLSPVLSSDETAWIIKMLWQDWRRVERRYLATCQRDAINETEKTLSVLIEHMVKSVRTLAGLLEFFPRFMR